MIGFLTRFAILLVSQWEKIPEHSTGPYELTTKSNGCIILIAALSPNHLIVTSKHSIGANSNLTTEGSVSHSERGEYWLERHLEKVGKTKDQLAKELFERNLTAVAEVSLECLDLLIDKTLIRTPQSHSYAMTLSKNMSYPIQLNKPVSTYTESITILPYSTLSPLPKFPNSPKLTE